MHKEKTPEPFPEKLMAAVALDYPEVREVLVSFPDRWNVIDIFPRNELNLYAAGFEPAQERADPNHFHGISPEINRTLTQYRQYKLFEPWPQPTISVNLEDTVVNRPEKPSEK